MMQDSDTTSSQPQKIRPREVTARLHAIIADGLVCGITADEVLRRYEHDYGHRGSAQRRLKRMLRAGKTVKGDLRLVAPSAHFHGLAFVQVKCDFEKLRRDAVARQARGMRIPRRGQDEVVSSEEMVEAIVSRTQRWQAEPQLPDGEPRVPAVALADAFLIHGTFEGILLSYYYRNLAVFTRYLEEVLNRVPHVERTWVMFVDSSPAQLRSSGA